MCIQTKEWFTFHIKTARCTLVDYDNYVTKGIIHASKHGMGLDDGSQSEREVQTQICSVINKYAEVYVTDLAMKSLFNSWGYYGVEVLMSLPPSYTFAPASTCGSYGHDTGFQNCAQRKCFEIMIFLGP